MNVDMLSTNCCKFMDYHPSATESLQPLHFIRETKHPLSKKWQTLSYYQLYYVLEGNGILQTEKDSFILKKGTLFLTLPASPYLIKPNKQFVYLFIGFIGPRANQLIDAYKISTRNCVFYNFEHIEQLWINALDVKTENLHLSAESTILFSFACIGELNFTKTTNTQLKKQDNIEKIKEYIDLNFANSELSLQTISKQMGYSPKYISHIFNLHYKMNFKTYLNTYRIEKACLLIENGNSYIKEIAFLCGFNDPLYFSKIFKQKMNITASEFIKDYKQRKKTNFDNKLVNN